MSAGILVTLCGVYFAGLVAGWWPTYTHFCDNHVAHKIRNRWTARLNPGDRFGWGLLTTVLLLAWPVLLMPVIVIPAVSRRIWTGKWYGQDTETKVLSARGRSVSGRELNG